MSDNIPSSSLSRKRSKRRYDRTKLPTPPPDPPEKVEKDDFFTYLDSLQKCKSTSIYAPVIATEDAFDHLEKLYKLMEQMLELREQNARLHRRIRDLEQINKLEKLRQDLNLDIEDESSELDKDTAFAETILESILSETKSTKQKIPPKLRHSVYRKHRMRCGSVSVAALRHQDPLYPQRSRRASTSVELNSDVKQTAKVSKWTRVKAAFKWEKASTIVSDAKSQDSGVGGLGTAPVEVARYLRVLSYDEHGHSPVDSGAAEISTPGSLSTASSAEDIHRHDARSHCSSDDDHSHYTPHSKEGSQKANKCHKTPWAKMKDIIHTRNSFKKKRSSTHSDDIQMDVEYASENEEVFEEPSSSSLSPEMIERYRQAANEDGDGDVSKWTRVKKTFLPSQDTSALTHKEQNAEDEIQKNYIELQKKLSLEFQDKLLEWERMKQSSSGITSPSTFSFTEESKNPDFMKKMEEWQKIKAQPSFKRHIPITSGENLPPEFRKKLQEWEKIRKSSNKEISKKKLADVPRWKSLSAPKSDCEYSNLSEDFKKKLEEWKQIKSASHKQARDLPKPKKELQWFEKELTKIEKEKQRLEREKQKFLEREESLSKLRNSVIGGLKKEVLINTPSGFIRFEGISRKFTQKLYEWEKAQGIAPESSTFALLNSSLTQDTNKNCKTSNTSLVRSKSADSIAIPILPLMNHPSSLSLNDVEALEQECLAESRSISQEPEALIVEVEDIIEETAAPLPTYEKETQKPIYQRQELKLCEGETCAAPKIRRSESARAQNNYNLIEEVFSILKNLVENELEIQKIQDLLENKKDNTHIIRLKMFDESQKAMSIRLSEKILRLQDANVNVFVSFGKEEMQGQVTECLETVQDLSMEIYQLTEKLDYEINNRNVYDFGETGAKCLNPINEIAHELRNKLLEMRRRLSYVCAASDLTAPRRRSLKKRVSKERERLYVKAECNQQSQGAIKRRLRYRQKAHSSKAMDTDEEEEMENKHRKLTKTFSVSETETKSLIDKSFIQKVVVPTESNFLDVCGEETSFTSPVGIFVQTTRKLFTPLVESTLMYLPPSSPVQARKTKEISPSIRIMMAKYNQNVEKDSIISTSPWQSPSAARRVRTQTERYQKELTVQKTASASMLHTSTSPETVLKSSSVTTFMNNKKTSAEIRSQKIQKAKEEFLNSRPSTVSVLLFENELKFPTRNRLSQISVESESSFECTLTKSASAGMINIDADTYRNIDPEVHREGYVSLPRNTKPPKEKFGFSNIAAKFRKVKMRKGKEKGMNTVSTLCRQSLVVDINEGKKHEEDKTSAETSPSSSRSGSWIRKPKFFNK